MEVPCLLTPRDVAILQVVESFRLVTSEQIMRLVEGSAQNILRRLQKLFHAQYVDRLRPRFVNGGGSSKMVYAITNKGVRLLQTEGVLNEVSKTSRDAQNRELSDLFMRHTLLISHIRTVLTAACKELSALELVLWNEGSEIQDAIDVRLQEKNSSIPVAPDGFFSIEQQDERAHFFLEADRGTMSLSRFILKLKAYAAYWRAKRHTKKFGIDTFRVLTVTSSSNRRENLLKAAAAEPEVERGGWMFLFTTEEDLPLSRPATIFEEIWTTPAREEPCSILG
jgi:protein involved in plasmid replication-relaxation